MTDLSAAIRNVARLTEKRNAPLSHRSIDNIVYECEERRSRSNVDEAIRSSSNDRFSDDQTEVE